MTDEGLHISYLLLAILFFAHARLVAYKLIFIILKLDVYTSVCIYGWKPNVAIIPPDVFTLKCAKSLLSLRNLVIFFVFVILGLHVCSGGILKHFWGECKGRNHSCYCFITVVSKVDCCSKHEFTWTFHKASAPHLKWICDFFLLLLLEGNWNIDR